MWIRDVTFQKQIYVSSNYDSIWGHSSEKLYNYPESFKETVFIEDRNIHQLATKIKSTVDQINSSEEKIYLYRIQKPNSKIVHIKDWHYVLTDNDDIDLGYIGFAKKISMKEWQNELGVKKHGINTLEKKILDICHKELKVKNSSNALNKFQGDNLTEQEKICLELLLQGNATKFIAFHLKISTRTVEFHLENIKNKFKCRTIVQLISKIMREFYSKQSP